MRINIISVISTLLLTTISLNAATTKWFVAPELSTKPDIELGLEDPVWKKALKISFTRLHNDTQDTDKYLTESYWLSVDGSLFVAFKCVNPSSPKLWAPQKQPRDQCVYRNESIELFIGDMREDLYYQFIVDARNNIYDGQRNKRIWNGDWKHKAFARPGYWVAIVEIPSSILSTIRQAGSFITIDMMRHAFRPDGTNEVVTALNPPGAHSPEDRLFIGKINPAELGKQINSMLAAFKKDFAKAPPNKTVQEALLPLEALADECLKAGDISLERYKVYYNRFTQAKKTMSNVKRDIVLNIILTPKPEGKKAATPQAFYSKDQF